MSTFNTTLSAVSASGAPTYDAFCSPQLSAAPHIPEKNMQPSKQVTTLTDTFPSKTHHLVTQLTETDPQVVTFSPDGAAFYIYDQVKFAEKYLPRYFKHSNYGSFVRQLNLYGFTSSRLKWNSDVIAWTHEFFHRDKREDLRNIKRPKKKERVASRPKTVPCEVPRPSSTSVSDDAESMSPSFQLNDGHAFLQGNGNNEEQHFLRKFSMDIGMEFAYLKQQNRFLEEKLDILLKITLNMGGPGVSRSGEKRPRIDASQGYSHDTTYTHSSSHHHDEFKDSEDSCFSSDHYVESKFSEDERDRCIDCEPLPYMTTGDGHSHERELPCGKTSVSESLLDHRTKNDTFAKFIEVMLTEENRDCGFSGDPGNIREKPALATVTREQAENASDQDEFKQGTEDLHGYDLEDHLLTEAISDDLEDETLSEAIGTIFQQSLDADHDIFSSSFDIDGDLPISSHEGHCNSRSAGLVAMSNCTIDKVSGPEPIFSTDVVVEKTADIEEGHLAYGVALVSAQVVRDESETMNEVDHVALQQELDRQREKKKNRCRLIYFLIFVMVAVVCVFVTWRSGVIGRDSMMEQAELNADSEAGMGSADSEDTIFHENGLLDDGLISNNKSENDSLNEVDTLAKNQNHSQIGQTELNLDSETEMSSKDSEDSEGTILHENGLFGGGPISETELDDDTRFEVDKLPKNQNHFQMEQTELTSDSEMEMSSEDSDDDFLHESGLYDDALINNSQSDDDSLNEVDTRAKNQSESSVRSSGSLPFMSYSDSLFTKDTLKHPSFFVTIAGIEFSCSQNILSK